MDQHRNSTGNSFVAVLFSIYLADCRSSNGDCIITKYADDTVLTGQIIDNDDTHFQHEINSCVQWCEQNYWELNVCKTKETAIDFRRNIPVSDFVVIKGVELERVETFNYLGVIFDNGLGWKENTNTTVKKAHTRLYCLRKLRTFDTSPKILQMILLVPSEVCILYRCVLGWKYLKAGQRQTG